MQRITKKLALVLFIGVFAAATITSCGKQKEEHPAGEHPADSTATAKDSTEHPSDTTAGEHPEHPQDTTKN